MQWRFSSLFQESLNSPLFISPKDADALPVGQYFAQAVGAGGPPPLLG
ncbi:hypothetical protein DJ56_962 [Yersinia pestis]|nr:hypothetical protein DJ56_962 [Yersinia pestis]